MNPAPDLRPFGNECATSAALKGARVEEIELRIYFVTLQL
jgi:hypothetical protein